MSKILYVLYPSLILILVTVFISTALSQVVTNNSNVSSSIIHTGKVNKSKIITVIDAVGDIECSNNLHDQLKKDILPSL